MLEKILVPLDGSDLGELALLYVSELAAAIGKEVHLLSVVSKQDEEYTRMAQIYLEKITEDTRRVFSKVNPDIKVKQSIVPGTPAEKIVEYASEKKMSLAIIVSHGHTGIMPWSMGSTANKVVHTIHIPVLLARAGMLSKKRRPASLFGKILLPLDGSEVGEAALPYVVEIARKLKSEVTLISVIEPVQSVHTIGGQDSIRFPEAQVEKMKADAHQYLKETLIKLAENGVNVKSIEVEGNAAEQILKFTQKGKIRLVAMSSHGRSGMRGWVFGSVSNKVLQAGKASMLVVRPPPHLSM